MIIYLNGQDINRIILANLQEGIEEKDIVVTEMGTEGFLKAFRDFLSSNNIGLGDVEKLFVVIGPGSATALRSSLAIVNTLGFSNAIDLVGIEKEKDEQDIDTIKKLLEQGLSTFDIKNVLMPKYEHKPRITISTKDALRRRR